VPVEELITRAERRNVSTTLENWTITTLEK
jgi:hypothetical protein